METTPVKTEKKPNAIVEPIAHFDVKGNKQLYIKITSNEKMTIINIGQKTFDGLLDTLTPKEEKPKGGK